MMPQLRCTFPSRNVAEISEEFRTNSSFDSRLKLHYSRTISDFMIVQLDLPTENWIQPVHWTVQNPFAATVCPMQAVATIPGSLVRTVTHKLYPSVAFIGIVATDTFGFRDKKKFLVFFCF